jgi:hypothetical protein
VEPAIENILTEDINKRYKTTTCKEDYINPTTDGMLSWRSISSCASDSYTGLEKWKQRFHELSTRICVKMTCTLRWFSIEVREPPTFYGLNDLEELLMKCEVEVLENHRLPTLDISFKGCTYNMVENS